jgi:spermidine synthase
MERKLHPNVQLAEGVVVAEQEWLLFGAMLICGVPNHRVLITGFPTGPEGIAHIRLRISPLDQPEPLQFRES